MKPSSHHPVTLLRAVSYIRVSTSNQAGRNGGEGLSIPAQREAIRRKATELGALVAAEFVDRGRTGRTLNRPGLQRLLEHIKTTPLDFVIVHKIDRLARNRSDDAILTAKITTAGARLVSTTEVIDSTPSGALVHGIMASIAEFYSRNLATEVLKGMRQKVQQGGTPGRAPLGYLNLRKYDHNGQDTRTVIIDPDRGEHIAWAFTAYASSEWSVSRLAVELNTRGLTLKSRAASPPQPVTVRTVHFLLRNPYYKGVVTLNGEEFTGNHEPLVDPVTWAKVQKVLSSKRNGQRSRTHDHYLKGTVFCIECKNRLTLQSTYTRHGTTYTYFVCHKQRSPDCPQRKALPVTQVEQRVVDYYRTIELSSSQRENLEEVMLAELHLKQKLNETRHTDLDAAITKLKSHRAKLLDAHYADAVPKDLFLSEQRRLKSELAHLTIERAATETDLDALRREVDETLNLLENAHTVYELADDQQRIELNQLLLARVFLGYEPEQIRVELHEQHADIRQHPKIR
ncbi:recombinase family protein [Lysinibacter cavernae]|uniref:DNA invertase Pin-like site-specific DNA recombinase n=1 Tax=Lysinibacter cavernae TaxID=1640652 RepID=A0A7X5R3I8_9MICO|nr:recombinase family protein [Lysinibacter cavernae]NIH55019.1 DNA invertase Pin-like site-specific DNA recombinase [Lysinibacter cavernae]